MQIRLWIARRICPPCHAVVPREASSPMLKAAAKAMSPAHRPTPERVSVRRKHAIRWAAMVAAAVQRGEA